MVAIRLPRQTFPKQILLDQKQPKNMKYFIYLGSTITNDARYTRKIKYGIAISKAAIYKKALGTSRLDISLWKKLAKVLHSEHSFVWC